MSKFNIEISHVTKIYEGKIVGLEDVTINIGQGVFGLLGHNGAGKTTLMKLMTTILVPTSGTINILGENISKNGRFIRKNIGYLPQEISIYPNLNVSEFISYMAALKGVNDGQEVKKALEAVDMLEYAEKKISQLSGGMKRRVGIAQAIVGTPKILIVDEPTAGLDPEERVRFKAVLSRYARGGRTVVFSTHIVDDVYQLCDNIAVIRGGKLFYSGEVGGLIGKIDGKVKIVHLKTENELNILQNTADILSITYENNDIMARIVDVNNCYSGKVADATLEDAYIYCMGGKKYEACQNNC